MSTRMENFPPLLYRSPKRSSRQSSKYLGSMEMTMGEICCCEDSRCGC